MTAEVAPPGVCAMPKVSGSRMATPLAPPSPGSTPMIRPRSTPGNISATVGGVSATPKPGISAVISPMSVRRPSVQSDPGFHRALGQGHLEPHLEDQVEAHHGGEAHKRHPPPRVLAKPAHEEADEQHR